MESSDYCGAAFGEFIVHLCGTGAIIPTGKTSYLYLEDAMVDFLEFHCTLLENSRLRVSSIRDNDVGKTSCVKRGKL